MKILILILFLIVILGIYIYWFNPSYLSSITKKITSLEVLLNTPKKPALKFYKWRNKDGEIQISNIPPAHDIHYTVTEIEPNTNIIPSN